MADERIKTPEPDAEALLAGDCAVVVQDLDVPERALAVVRVGTPVVGGTPVPPALARQVGPLLERLPALVSDGQRLLGEQTYRVVLKPEFLKSVRDGSLRMMDSKEVAGGFRLNVVVNRPGRFGSKPGTIVGQGTNVPVSRVARLATAGFQIATYATAQVHLAEINKRLAGIERTTRDILQHLHDVQTGALAGKAGRLREIAERMQAGDIRPDEVNRIDDQLDAIDLAASEVAEAVLLEVRRREAEVRGETVRTSWWDGGVGERERVGGEADRLASGVGPAGVRAGRAAGSGGVEGAPSPCVVGTARASPRRAAGVRGSSRAVGSERGDTSRRWATRRGAGSGGRAGRTKWPRSS